MLCLPAKTGSFWGQTERKCSYSVGGKAKERGVLHLLKKTPPKSKSPSLILSHSPAAMRVCHWFSWECKEISAFPSGVHLQRVEHTKQEFPFRLSLSLSLSFFFFSVLLLYILTIKSRLFACTVLLSTFPQKSTFLVLPWQRLPWYLEVQ